MAKMNEIRKIRVLLIAVVLVTTCIGCPLRSDDDANTEDPILERVLITIAFFENAQMPSGEICDPEISIFDVWETVNASLAVSLWADYIDWDVQNMIEKACYFLKSSENANGMVLHNKNHHGTFCLETSSEYICLLIRIYSAAEPKVMEKLEYVKLEQLPSGPWNIVSPVIPPHLQRFPSVTGFALKALLSGGQTPKDYNSAMKFLLNLQNTDGCWGVEGVYYGTPFYVMAPILWILNRNKDEYHDALTSARKYLIESQNDDGSWFYELEGFPCLPSAELQSALALQCCLYCGLGPDNETVSKGINWLLDKQMADGHWDGGYFPIKGIQKKEDIYATSQALITLHQYWLLKNNKDM